MMRFTVDRQALARRLDVVERILPKKAGLPFHHAVFFSARGDQCVLHCSAYSESYRSRLAAETQERGEIVVSGEELIRAVSVAPGSEITIADDGQETVIISDSARWAISALEGVAYMQHDEVLPSELHETTREDVLTALNEVRYAASRTEARPSLRQIHVGEGRMIASDGRRLHQTEFGYDGPGVDIPERMVDVIVDMLGPEPGGTKVAILQDGSTVFVSSESSLLTMGKLSYEFPDLDSLILSRTEAQTGIIQVNRERLITALKVAGSFSDHVKLTKSGLTIQVRGSTIRGESVMGVEIEETNLEEFEFWFNGQELREALSRLSGVVISARVPDPKSSNPGWFYVSEDGVNKIAVRSMLI